MTSKCVTLLTIFLICSLSKALTLKTQDIVKAGSNVASQALTESGQAKSQTQSVANAGQFVVNAADVQHRQEDQVLATAGAKSDSLTGFGDALGSAVSQAAASRQEVNPVNFNYQDQVASLAGAQTNAGTDRGNAGAYTAATALSSNRQYNELGNVVQAAQNVQLATGIWYDTGKKVTECAVGAFGDIFCIGLDKRIYFYDILDESFTLLKADYTLEGVTRIAVASDATVYAVTVTGETFYYSCRNTWVRIEGCATDIAVGLYGEVYKIGCDVKNGGLGVYKLFCQGDSCFKGCKRHRLEGLANDFDDERSCHWFRIEGAGVRLAVHPSGHPVVTHIDGSVWAFNGSDWEAMGSSNALDLCVTNDGTVYTVGNDRMLYKQKEELIDRNKNSKRYTYKRISGVSNASAVTCAPLNLPFVVVSNRLWNCINTHYN